MQIKPIRWPEKDQSGNSMQHIKNGFFMMSRQKTALIGPSIIERGIYDILVEMAHIHTHTINITIKELAKKLDIDDRTLRRTLCKFEAKKLISIDRCKNQYGSTSIKIEDYREFCKNISAAANDQAFDQAFDQANCQAKPIITTESETRLEDLFYSGAAANDQAFDQANCQAFDQANRASILEEKKIRKRKEKGEKKLGSSAPSNLPEVKLSGAPIFEAYASAYLAMYGQAPVRNAKQNAHAKRIAERLGIEAGILTAQFFLTHRKKFYVDCGHSLSILEKDCEILDVQRRKGRQMTDTLSRRIDESAAMDQVFQDFIDRHKGE